MIESAVWSASSGGIITVHTLLHASNPDEMVRVAKFYVSHHYYSSLTASCRTLPAIAC
jgi:hypothetical protein